MTLVPDIKPKVLVIGDLIVDQYLWGTCERISPEAPVQIVDIESENSQLGGAGNVIHNLYSLDADVDIISVIGTCNTSKVLLELLEDIEIKTNYLITENERVTSKKTRVISSNQQVIRYDKEITDEINQDSQKKIIKCFQDIVNNYDVVLLSDYGKGIFTSELTQELIKIANINNIKVLVDPKGLDYSKYKGAFLLTPNKKEAGEATHSIIKDTPSLLKAMIDLKKQCELQFSLITLSEQGVALFDDELKIYPTVAREVFDVTGAGDTILASLGFALACNKNIEEAIKFANLASGVVVGKIGSATTTLKEIIEYESNINKTNSNGHIKNWSEISLITKELKLLNKKVVFTNGCFDLIHVGHIKYLEESKGFGDVLIVGLNSDKSIKNLKGPDRPIYSQDDRAYILASIEAIDFVVIFEEETPLELIKLIQPDVLVKGKDYKNKKIVGREIAKELKLVKFYEGKSTTNTINKIIKT